MKLYVEAETDVSDSSPKKIDKRQWFKDAVNNGSIYYDEDQGGFVWDYHDMEFSQEIFLGSSDEKAYKAFCQILW